jgi:hypothetical protein
MRTAILFVALVMGAIVSPLVFGAQKRLVLVDLERTTLHEC